MSTESAVLIMQADSKEPTQVVIPASPMLQETGSADRAEAAAGEHGVSKLAASQRVTMLVR